MIKSHENNKLIFVTYCGSSFKDKYDKFGHNHVFNDVKSILKDKCLHFEAFPVGLVLPDEQKEDSDAFMKVHLNEKNFNDKIVSIYDTFIRKI